LLGSLALASAAHAQAAKMFGSVTDDAGQGLPDVKILLEPTGGEGARVQVASKGKKGSYFFGLIRPGTYVLKVDAPEYAISSIKAHAALSNPGDKAKEWDINGRVNPEKPPQMRIDDAMSITCDIVLGKAMAAPSAGGGGTTGVTADQAYAQLAHQVQQGDCAGALPGVDTFLAANPQHGRAYYLKGFCDAVLDKNEDAAAALEKSIELDPSFAGSRTLLGKVYGRLGKLPEAEAALRKELENTSAAPEVQVDAWLSLGAVLRDAKKQPDAIQAFEKVIEIAPSRPEPYVELAGMYADSGQLDKADAVLARAKAAGADDPAALLHVAISYFNKKDNAHAEAMCRRLIDGGKATPPDLAAAYAILGRTQLNSGKIDDGVASLKKSIELDPTGRFAAQSEDILKALKKK
jgi:tetratricopeptide (TPR) repeat protein